ncbi:hypothetical protein T492DRAFT_864017 [Pavlovales sp. CCMP2436]|nr:hypothetical protein T492DRAFT_864017 [Pavlovales sp. CCMP2436]
MAQLDGPKLTKKDKVEYCLANGSEDFIVKYKMKGLVKNLVKSLNALQIDKAYDELVNGPAREAAANAANAAAALEKEAAGKEAADLLAEQKAAHAEIKAAEEAAKAAAAVRAERMEDSSWATRLAEERIAKLKAARGQRAAASSSSTTEAAVAAAAAIIEAGLAGLPTDCLRALHLDPVSAVRLGLTCTRLRAAVLLEPSSWESLSLRDVQPASLRTDDALDALAALAQGALGELDCTGCPLLSRGAVSGVAEANAKTLHTLRAVGLSGNSCWSTEQLKQLQARCPSLATLELDMVVDRLGPEASALLASAQLPRVAGLKVRNVGPEDAADAGRLTAAAPWLRSLVLEGCSATSLQVEGARLFAAELAKAPKEKKECEQGLTNLDCPRTYMQCEGIVALSAALSALGSLRSLSLPSNMIRIG